MKSETNKRKQEYRCILVYVVFFTFCFSFFISSCSGRYVGLPRAEVLAYQTTSTYGSLHALSTAYGEAINAAIKADTLHPGMYADYGVTLALMGHKDAACRMLNAEVKAFPESRGLVYRIKQRLMPDLLNDTISTGGETANLDQLAAWAYDSITALRPLPYTAPVIDSTDTVWISQQTPIDSVEIPIRLTANEKRELLAKQQNEAAQRKTFVADSIAAARKAAADARKADQKAREKQREEERKQKAAQREAERKQKAADREATRKAREAEKNSKKK